MSAAELNREIGYKALGITVGELRTAIRGALLAAVPDCSSKNPSRLGHGVTSRNYSACLLRRQISIFFVVHIQRPAVCCFPAG